jgi:serine/threonine protein kinase
VYLPSLLRDVLPFGTFLHGDKYRIDYPLGRGGFGVTYRGIHCTLNQMVAIKEFYPQELAIRDGKTGKLSVPISAQGSYQQGVKRFLKEGQILVMMNHPNIVRVQDLFEERGTAYLVMELVDGQTLRDELDAQPGKSLATDRVKVVMEQLVDALAALHEKEVYHLDLKPDNLMFTREGRLVLVDFGSAHQSIQHPDNTQPRTIRTFAESYAAPEVITGGEVGPESDIFELGMMLYEMLTGKLPKPAFERLINDTWNPNPLEKSWQFLIRSSLKLSRDDRPKSIRKWWNESSMIKVASESIHLEEKLIPNEPLKNNRDETTTNYFVTALMYFLSSLPSCLPSCLPSFFVALSDTPLWFWLIILGTVGFGVPTVLFSKDNNFFENFPEKFNENIPIIFISSVIMGFLWITVGSYFGTTKVLSFYYSSDDLSILFIFAIAVLIYFIMLLLTIFMTVFSGIIVTSYCDYLLENDFNKVECFWILFFSSLLGLAIPKTIVLIFMTLLHAYYFLFRVSV